MFGKDFDLLLWVYPRDFICSHSFLGLFFFFFHLIERKSDFAFFYFFLNIISIKTKLHIKLFFFHSWTYIKTCLWLQSISGFLQLTMSQSSALAVFVLLEQYYLGRICTCAFNTQQQKKSGRQASVVPTPSCVSKQYWTHSRVCESNRFEYITWVKTQSWVLAQVNTQLAFDPTYVYS